jgi:hypothetical protein
MALILLVIASLQTLSLRSSIRFMAASCRTTEAPLRRSRRRGRISAPPGARASSHYCSLWSRSPVYLQRVFGKISPVSGINPIVRRQYANRPEAVLMISIIVLTMAVALANDDKGS